MKCTRSVIFGVVLLLGTGSALAGQAGRGEMVALPRPETEGGMSLHSALSDRRSVRSFRARALTLSEIAQVLWAAQGVTHQDGYRTAPSAGALYPLELYLCVGRVADLADGIYHYRPQRHDLLRVSGTDVRRDLARAAVRQTWLADGAVVIVFAGAYRRTTAKYGERGVRYVHMEVGHAAQNVYLQATALGLGTTFVGAFHDERVAELVGLREGESPLGLMPIGGSGR